jgi:hypothetical protein
MLGGASEAVGGSQRALGKCSTAITNYKGCAVTVEKIVGLIGIAIGIIAAFVTIPYVALALLVAGLIVGLSMARDDHVRVIVSALALTAFAHNFDAVPEVGKYLASIIANGGMLAAGAAMMVVLRNMYARFTPMKSA